MPRAALLWRHVERESGRMHLISLMQQQPVYVFYIQFCVCERRLHHLCRTTMNQTQMGAAAPENCHSPSLATRSLGPRCHQSLIHKNPLTGTR